MKQFIGEPGRDGCSSRVLVHDDEENKTKLLPHHVYHSPDGFSWGYAGSGPSELARCILWEVLDHPEPPPPTLYHRFKEHFLLELDPNSGFVLDESYIWDWLEGEGVVR